MIAGVVHHVWFRQTPAWRDKAVDAFAGAFVPLDVERTELREELQMGIGQVVVDLPGQCPPVGPVGRPVGEPRDDDTGGRPHAAIGVAAVPDVSGVVLVVRGTVEFVPVAEFVQRGGAESAADIDAAEGRRSAVPAARRKACARRR